MSILSDVGIINIFLTPACPFTLLIVNFDEQNILILI